MNLISKIISVLVMSGITSLPLYAHTGSHPMGVFEALAHFFSSPIHLGLVAIALVSVLVLIIVRAIDR